MVNLLELKNVSKVYDNQTQGLKDISLKVNQGEFIAVIGLSGAGKSTLLRSINRMIEITSGKIKFNGKDVSRLKGDKLRKYRRKVGMIFQDFNLVNNKSVLYNVLSGKAGYYPTWKTMLGLYSKADKEKAAVSLKHVNMLKKIYSRVDNLSGGQMQRVAIARTMMQNPSLVLADEPVASLDPKISVGVMGDLKNLNEKDGDTVLVNLHSIQLALDFSTRIVGLRNGQVVFDKPTNKASKSELSKIYEEGS